mmetsp:Transcript_146304/g.270022  ORF Transcript_146304/g.270022 Transcript_146304/m.270022 type:complete len:200 (-) Transcript_146304:584-1183(-)
MERASQTGSWQRSLGRCRTMLRVSRLQMSACWRKPFDGASGTCLRTSRSSSRKATPLLLNHRKSVRLRLMDSLHQPQQMFAPEAQRPSLPRIVDTKQEEVLARQVPRRLGWERRSPRLKSKNWKAAIMALAFVLPSLRNGLEESKSATMETAVRRHRFPMKMECTRPFGTLGLESRLLPTKARAPKRATRTPQALLARR